MEGTAAPLRFGGASSNGAILVARDTTERDLLQEALAAREAEFRSMFELAAVGMAQADPSTGRFVGVNQRLCEITGYSEGELLGLSFPELTHPEDRAQDFRIFQLMVSGERPEYSSEKRYVRKDGRVVWVHAVARLVRGADGRSLRISAVIRDISDVIEARRQAARAERRTLAVTENATMGLLLMDARQHCVPPTACG